MDLLCYLRLYVLFESVVTISSWQFFSSFQDLTMSNSEKEPRSMHSEYIYGDCKQRGIKFYSWTQLDSLQVLGKVIVRGWMDFPRIPTCIILRGYAHEEDTFRSTSYQFQMCVPRITYCHTSQRIKYYYYEWYIPPDMIGGMYWQILFYGPSNMECLVLIKPQKFRSRWIKRTYDGLVGTNNPNYSYGVTKFVHLYYLKYC